ncbi:MAG: ExbD/TolR family protein [Aeoliella sp.]
MAIDTLESDVSPAFTPPPKKRTDDELDMTPMVDVTFLLLIFFMVTAAFAMQKALKVPPVAEDEVSSQPVEDIEKDSIIVRLDADNVFWVGGPLWTEEQKAVTSLDMRAKVREAREGGSGGRGPSKMMVEAHEDAVYEKLVDALDAGSDASIEEVRLSIVPDEDF